MRLVRGNPELTDRLTSGARLNGMLEEYATRRAIEAAIARRGDPFALSYLARTKNGYMLRFGLGVVDILRSRVPDETFQSLSAIDRLLDEVRTSFTRLGS